MAKIQCTLFSINSGLKMNTGEEVIITFDPNSNAIQHDPKALKVSRASNGEDCGVIGGCKKETGSNFFTVIKGTKSNAEVFDEMTIHCTTQTDGSLLAKGKIVGEDKILLKNGANKTAFIVEILFEKKQQASGVKFELEVKGSIRLYKGKTLVLDAINNNEDILLWIEQDGDKIVTFTTNGGETLKAGAVSTVLNGDESKLISYLEQSKQQGKVVNVKTTSANANAYNVEFTIEKESFEATLSGKTILSLDEVKKELISNGIVAQSTLEEISEYLKNNKVNEKHIKKVFESMKEYEPDMKARIPNPKVKYFDTANLVNKSVVYINNGEYLRFVGEKGTGKNVLIATLAWIYQRPLFEMALNSQTDKMDILGSKTFETVIDTNGKEITKMSFEPEVLIEAMQCGGFMNLDEVNTCDPSVLTVLNPIADDRRHLEVPGYEHVESNSNFTLILSMNENYIGTQELNEATRERFTTILFSNNDSIAKLLKVRLPEADPNDIKLADRVYGSIVKSVREGQLTTECITIRGFISAVRNADDLGLYETLMDNVANDISDLEYRATVSSFIDDHVG